MLKGQILNLSGLKRCLTDFKKFCLLQHKTSSSNFASCRSLSTLNSNGTSFCRKQQTSQHLLSDKHPKFLRHLPENFPFGLLTCYSGTIRQIRWYCASCWQRHTNRSRQTCICHVPSVAQTVFPPVTVISRSVVTEKTLAAESPVKTVSPTTKKRVARKKAHEKEVTAEADKVDIWWKFRDTVKILSFWTDMPGQTVQTQIRLLLEEQSDQVLHCLPFRLHCLASLLYGKATYFKF